MKATKYMLAALSATALLTGCLSDFQELNTDGELLGNADPRNAFTGATRNFNNCSRAHLTGMYSGNMVYMQYVVASGGPSAGNYVDPAKPNNHPEPYSPAFSTYYTSNNDGFGAFGLRLDYLVNSVIPQQTDPERYADIGAVAKILLGYEQWLILDTYGAAPITEGLKSGQGIFTPRYDLFQAAVDGEPMYKKIDAEVKAAVETLKASDEKQYALGTADFFHQGDIAKWIKFANTLRVKMAQRVEKADPAFYNAVVGEVLASPDNIIASNDESCIYHHPNDYNNNTDDIQDITSRYCASRAFVNYLKAYSDPRLPIMVRRNGMGEGNNNAENDSTFRLFAREYPGYAEGYAGFTDRYTGMSANPDSAGSEYSKGEYITRVYHKDSTNAEANLDIRINSQVESRFFVKNGGTRGNNNMPNRAIEDAEYMENQDNIGCFTPIITYPETCFMLAEIALKKGAAVAGKDATAWFRDGIKASMEQYRDWAGKMKVVAQVNNNAANYAPITDKGIAEYLARPEFQEATLEKIISQQWINLYMQPAEMWATWKRTGLPAFKAQPEPVGGVAFFEELNNAGSAVAIPRRNSLPTPNSMNMPNYESAVEALKGDAKYGTDVQNTEGRIWWDAE